MKKIIFSALALFIVVFAGVAANPQKNTSYAYDDINVCIKQQTEGSSSDVCGSFGSWVTAWNEWAGSANEGGYTGIRLYSSNPIYNDMNYCIRQQTEGSVGQVCGSFGNWVTAWNEWSGDANEGGYTGIRLYSSNPAHSGINYCIKKQTEGSSSDVCGSFGNWVTAWNEWSGDANEGGYTGIRLYGTPPNSAPTVSVSAPSSVTTGEIFSVTVNLADVDCNLSYYTLRWVGFGVQGDGPISSCSATKTVSLTAPSTASTMELRGEVVDTVGAGATHTVYVTVTAPVVEPEPSCSSSAPQSSTTSATSGTFYVYAYGVQNADSVAFYTWGEINGQNDMVPYSGTNMGSGTWRAGVNLGNHNYAGSPELGPFAVHIYMSNSDHSEVFCPFTANFTRTAPNLTADAASPSTAVAGAPQTFSATVSNIGNASTGASFSNFWQRASSVNGNGTIENFAPSAMGALVASTPSVSPLFAFIKTAFAAGATSTSPSMTFAAGTTPSVRVCANKDNPDTALPPGTGTFTESNWGDNCGAWTNVTVTNAPVPVVSISANPTSGTVNVVNPGLTWSATNSPTSCTASGDWSGSKPVSGTNVSQGVLTTVKTYVYTLTCSNAGGASAPESASVTVTAPAALGISTPANSTITLPNTTFYASYALTNGTGANTDCYLLDYNSAVLKTDLTCASPMSYNTPASSGSYGYFMRAVKSSTNETKTSGMFTVTVTNAAAGLPTVTSPTSASITSTSATLGGNITSNGGSALTERGVCWSVSPSTNASDGCNLATGTSTGVFTKDVTGLTSGRLHYYKAFARNSAGYGYSPISSFTTSGSSSLPDLIASAFTGPSTVPVDAAQNYISTVTNIGNARAGIPDSYAFQNLWQKATAWNGGGQVSDWGYSSMGALDPGDSADSSLWITFTSPGNYSIRTCADKNSSGNPGTISESDESENSNCGAWKNVTVTSAPTVPSVTTSAVSNITQTTATGGGNVTSNGGATVTVSGLVWSTSNNPTYNGGGPVSGSTGQTTDGWAIGGPWSSSMTGLSPNTTYHVRAYAVNSVGTAYGFNVQFITSAVSTYYDLRVTKNGAGADTGTVFSNIGGINCGSTCSDDYVSGSSVTLGASVTGGGTFAGWSGAGCSGTGACTILMNSAKNVKATFTAAPCANRATNPPACTTGGGGNCLNGATNPPICTTGGGTMSGTLIPSRASCTIASGASSCTINFSWSVTNPAVIGGTAVTSDINNSGASSPNFSIAPPVSSGTADNGTKTNVMIPYNSRTFYLYNNGIEPPLAVSNVFSSCVTDTEWNGTVCLAVPPPPPPSPPICGDGDVDSGEQCDDGENNGNYCPSTCNTSCEIVSPCRKRPIFIDD